MGVNTQELEYRMYGLVPYNLSDIQKGIQFGHAVVEYMLKYPVDPETKNETYKWATKDKTFIILNGGTTNMKLDETKAPFMEYKGTLNSYAHELRISGIKTAEFYEPDLGDQLTAVVFLADERVWNKEKYPDLKWSEGDALLGGEYRKKKSEAWFKKMGGKQNLFLREFLNGLKLA